jgi:hypothetical protein
MGWPGEAYGPSPSASVDSSARLDRLLRMASSRNRDFYLFLDHQYTPKSIIDLGAGALKGIDRERAKRLQRANDNLPVDQKFVFHIAKAEQNSSFFGSNGPYDSRYENDWEENGTSVSLVDFYPSSGRCHYPATECTAGFDEDSILNPDRRTMNGLWHGHRTTTYEGYLGNEGPTKDTTYHKYILTAWPAPCAIGLTLRNMGSEAAHKLAEAIVSERSLLPRVNTFLAGAKSMSRYDTVNMKQTRTLIIEYMLAEPNNFHLHNIYCSLFQATEALSYRSPAVANLMRMTLSPELWSMIQENIDATLAADMEGTVKVIQTVITSGGLSHTAFARLEEMVVHRMKRHSGPAEDVYDRKVPEGIWHVALMLPQPTLCQVLVDRYRVLAGTVDISSVITGLVAARIDHEESYNSRRSILSPLITAWSDRLLELRNQAVGETARLKDLSQRAHFPEASFPRRPDVEIFLRGPEKMKRIGAFSSLPNARRFISYDCTFNHYDQKAKFSVTGTAGGRGHDAFVDLRKTDEYWRKLIDLKALELDSLDRSLRALRLLLSPPTSTGAIASSGSKRQHESGDWVDGVEAGDQKRQKSSRGRIC